MVRRGNVAEPKSGPDHAVLNRVGRNFWRTFRSGGTWSSLHCRKVVISIYPQGTSRSLADHVIFKTTPIKLWNLIKGKWVSVEHRSLSHVRLFATLQTVAHQVPLSVEFSRQEYWSGLSFPSPGDLPDTGIKTGSPALQADSWQSEPPGKSQLKGNWMFIAMSHGKFSGKVHHRESLQMFSPKSVSC